MANGRSPQPGQSSGCRNSPDDMRRRPRWYREPRRNARTACGERPAFCIARECGLYVKERSIHRDAEAETSTESPAFAKIGFTGICAVAAASRSAIAARAGERRERFHGTELNQIRAGVRRGDIQTHGSDGDVLIRSPEIRRAGTRRRYPVATNAARAGIAESVRQPVVITGGSFLRFRNSRFLSRGNCGCFGVVPLSAAIK